MRGASIVLSEECMRQRREAEPAEAGGESAEDVGWKVNAEIDARKADAEDGHCRQRVYDRLRGKRAVLHEVMRDDRICRRRQQRMPARETVGVWQRDAAGALDRTL